MRMDMRAFISGVHFVGITWADGDKKGGFVMQCDKDDYRGVLLGLGGVTGKRAVDSDAMTASFFHSGFGTDFFTRKIPLTAGTRSGTSQAHRYGVTWKIEVGVSP